MYDCNELQIFADPKLLEIQRVNQGLIFVIASCDQKVFLIFFSFKFFCSCFLCIKDNHISTSVKQATLPLVFKEPLNVSASKQTSCCLFTK